MLEPTIPPPMRTTSAVCMVSSRVASGSRCGNGYPDQHHDGEPSEHDSKRSSTFDLADASDADGSQNQRPDGKGIQWRQQGAQHRGTTGIDEISRIGSG